MSRHPPVVVQLPRHICDHKPTAIRREVPITQGNGIRPGPAVWAGIPAAQPLQLGAGGNVPQNYLAVVAGTHGEPAGRAGAASQARFAAELCCCGRALAAMLQSNNFPSWPALPPAASMQLIICSDWRALLSNKPLSMPHTQCGSRKGMGATIHTMLSLLHWMARCADVHDTIVW